MQSRPNRLFSSRNLYALARGRIPGQVIIQMTDQCNAQCPQCEMRVGHRYPRSSLDKTNMEKILETAAKRGVAAVSFTGGEPFLHFDTLIEMIQRAGDLGIPLIRTGTSGYFLRHHEKEDFKRKVECIAESLANTPIRNFWFSIDSADPSVHDRIRGFPGVLEGIEKALPIFHEHGIWPTANLGVNRFLGGGCLRLEDNPSEAQREEFYENCLESFGRFYRRVIDIGFTIVNFCYPMSIESQAENSLGSVYRASSADDMVNFRAEEKALLFRAMLQAVRKYRHRIRIFTPLNTLNSLAYRFEHGKEHGYPCRGGKDFFFVSAADENAYPCGFRADENLGSYPEMKSTYIKIRPAVQLEEGSRASNSRLKAAPTTMWARIVSATTTELRSAIPINIGPTISDEHCTRCEWECFRDPSNTLGPFHEGIHDPGALVKRLVADRVWTRLWWEDMRYQKAADFCNGRLPPDYSRLAKFSLRPRAGWDWNRAKWSTVLRQKMAGKELKKLMTINQ